MMDFHARDDDLQHASRLIKDWLKRLKIQILPWPPYFNPIENLWDKLEQRVKKYDRTGTSMNTGME